MGSSAEHLERPGRHPAIAAAWSSNVAAPRNELVAADGCFDLIVRIDGAARRTAFVYEPVTAAHEVPLDVGDRWFGVRVRPGHGAALLEHRHELLRLAERSTAVDDAALAQLEALATGAVEITRPPAVVSDFVEVARASAGDLRLTSPSTSSRERELQRAARRWLGLTPKAFLRIERAWAARHAIRSGRPLATIAAELGYADQAHLTREIGRILGVTPRQLRPVGILQAPRLPHR